MTKIRMLQSRKGNGGVLVVFLLAIVLIGFVAFDFSPKVVQEQVQNLKVQFNDGLQIIQTKSYQICNEIKWSEIKAAGVKVTETSLDGFLQLCQRLSVNLGKFKVYTDIECRVLWVYCPNQDATNTEAYYVQFA